MKRSEAINMRTAIESAAESLDDKTASTASALFPRLKQDGGLVRAGTRINWRGTIKRAAVDLWDTEANDPDHAAVLWEDIEYRDGYRIIPDVITVGLAFSNGEKSWWGDELMESTVDNNVYTPAAWPDNWKAVQM